MVDFMQIFAYYRTRLDLKAGGSAEDEVLAHLGEGVLDSLADGLDIPRPQALERLHRAGIEPGLRPQALAIPDWVRLFRTN